MFQSPVFAQAFADVTGCQLELYNTDGAQGAARAAGLGAGIYRDTAECFAGLDKIQSIEPDKGGSEAYAEAYTKWEEGLAGASLP